MTVKHCSIYHITKIDNLHSILEEGGLFSINQQTARCLHHQCVAHESIQSRRSRTIVRCDPFGNLHDYVPFYFAPRSPMLYANHRGMVEGNNDGQTPIIHIVSSTRKIQEAELSFVFTDGHAIMTLSSFYNDLSDLKNIDWGVMKARYWFDTQEDPDKKRRRQAEFLVFNYFPWDSVLEIGVINGSMKQQVENILEGYELNTVVSVQKYWYY